MTGSTGDGRSTITILYVPADGPVTTLEIEPTLPVLQGLVGGLIEPITGRDWSAFVHEEGKLVGLPPNYRAQGLLARLGRPLYGDQIVGPVVFCGPPGPDGETTAVPQSVLDTVPTNWPVLRG